MWDSALLGGRQTIFESPKWLGLFQDSANMLSHREVFGFQDTLPWRSLDRKQSKHRSYSATFFYALNKQEAWDPLTCINFRPTRRNPFCSKRLMISPTSPRWTPSGLIAMKVRSLLAMVLERGKQGNDRTESLPSSWSFSSGLRSHKSGFNILCLPQASLVKPQSLSSSLINELWSQSGKGLKSRNCNFYSWFHKLLLSFYCVLNTVMELRKET